MKPKRKTPKRYELVKNYLLKICDRGHHAYYDIHLELAPEELEELHKGKAPNLEQLATSGRASIVEASDWDKFLQSGRKDTPALIERDVKIFWAVENLRNQKSVSINKAVDELISNWPPDFGPHLGDSVVDEIYKNYVPIFRFTQGEDHFLNFPLRDAAAYALREEKVLSNWFPNKPSEILEQVHKILELPFEEDIESEIGIYQRIRHKSFGVTYVHALGLRQESTGRIKDRFVNRGERIREAMDTISKKYEIEQNKLITVYRHYRLIEAQANGQNIGLIFEEIEEDFASTY